ncbi:MAG: hypothetical protein RL497_1800, partial [Pseudomonadota bacterium]
RRSTSISFPMKFYLPHPWGRPASMQSSVQKCLAIIAKIEFSEAPLKQDLALIIRNRPL